jgi:integrase
MRKNLTEIGLQNLRPQPKPYEIRDTKSVLRVVVFPSGEQRFICRYRFTDDKGTRTRKLTLQSGLSLADARIAVADAMKLLSAGRDPAEVKNAANASAAAADADTLQTVAELYLSRDGKKLKSVAEQRRCFVNHIFPVLGSKPIAKIVRSDIVKLLDKIVDEAGPFAADSARAYLSKLFSWYTERSDTFTSPMSRAISRRTTKEERKREHILSDQELRDVWAVAEKSESLFGSIVRLLLLTAARRNEVSGMPWSELQGNVWTLPSARSKKKNIIIRPLSDMAMAIIDSQKRIDGCQFVFAARRNSPFRGMSAAKRIFDREVVEYLKDTGRAVAPWRLHDLRRTARTLLSRARISADHAERCLGHVIGGVRGVYDLHDYAGEIRIAYDALAGVIEHIVHPRDNVVPLRA